MTKPKNIKKPDAPAHNMSFEELVKKALNTPLPKTVKKKNGKKKK